MRIYNTYVIAICAIFAVSVKGLYHNDVTAKNFDTLIDSSQAHSMIEFYAPWCGHCKTLAPEYEQLGKAFEKTKDVIIAQVDADKHKALAKRFQVTGFPTLKWLPKGAKFEDMEDVSAGRTAQELLEFVNRKTGLSKKLAGAGESAVQDITTATFKEKVLKDGTYALVGFFAPWCGHCKALKPTWEKLAALYADDKDVIIGSINCDEEGDLAKEYGVKGFPTIKYFGSNGPEDYQEGRDIEDFVKFMNEKTGLDTTTDGGVTSTGGTIAELKEHVKNFLNAETEEERGAVIGKCEETIKTLDEKTRDNFKYYTKVFSKIAEKGRDYIKTEKARLSKLLESGDDLKNKQKKSFMRRVNVLNHFSEL